MQFFWRYFKQHQKCILFYVLFCGVFFVVFSLYQLPIGAIFYPALLCGLIGILFLTVDFIRLYKKHTDLLKLQALTASMLQQLPMAAGMIEQDYRELVLGLKQQAIQAENNWNQQLEEMIDYYTVWAHQIKTPIAAMRLTLQNEDTELSRCLSSDLFRIEQYVEMVLAFLRLDSPSTDYVFCRQPLDGMIRSVIKKYAAEFIGRKLGLKYETVTLTVITDEKWLAFVLEQLLSNALKYTKSGSVFIHTEGTDTLCIADSGIGIAPEDLPRVFEKGYTGHNGRYDRRASGLGLYLCRQVCENLNIDISVESALGKGTVVRLKWNQQQLTDKI